MISVARAVQRTAVLLAVISLSACGSRSTDSPQTSPAASPNVAEPDAAAPSCDPLVWTKHLDGAQVVPIVDGVCDFMGGDRTQEATVLPLSCKDSSHASCRCAPLPELEEVKDKAMAAALTKIEGGALHLENRLTRLLLDEHVISEMREPCLREGVPEDAAVYRFTSAGGFPNRCGWQLMVRAEERGSIRIVVIKQRQFDPDSNECRCSAAVKVIGEAQWGEIERRALAADLAGASWDHTEPSLVKDGSLWGFEIAEGGHYNAAFRVSPSKDGLDRSFTEFGEYFMKLAEICTSR
jgi:hypothetical protein